MLTRFLFTLFMMASVPVFAQFEEETEVVGEDDLGDVSDEFQEAFFDALSQKAIRNYDKAVVLLKQCEKLEPRLASVHFQLGKNYLLLKKYDQAETSLLEALDLSSDRDEWILDTLYEVYLEKRDYRKSLEVLEQLVTINTNYREYLPQLYFNLQEYDNALDVIQSLDDALGTDANRTRLKQRIYNFKKRDENATVSYTTGDADEKQLLEKLSKNPKSERAYIELIYLYSQKNNKNAAFATAKQFESKFPNNGLAHMALYKHYLDAGEYDNALKSMNVVFQTDDVDDQSKFKVFNDFLAYSTTNQRAASDLDRVISMYSVKDPSVIYTRLADFYLERKEPAKALTYYERGLADNPNSYKLITSYGLLLIDAMEYQKAADTSVRALDVYPSQPLVYLIAGVSNNKLQNWDDAILYLESGIDYVLDDTQMTRDFLIQLVAAHTGAGNTRDASKFQQQLDKLN